jgi:hypothetical protein
LGHENALIVAIEYDEKLLLFIIMEANKLLMPNKIEKAFDLHSQVDFEGLFHITCRKFQMCVRMKNTCFQLLLF